MIICRTTVKQLSSTFDEKLPLTTVWNKIGWKAEIKEQVAKTEQYKCYESQASRGTVNDCHQMAFLAARKATRILIRNLHHRHGLPLTRPAFLLGEGRPDTRERRKSSLLAMMSDQNIKLVRQFNPQITCGLTMYSDWLLIKMCFQEWTGPKIIPYFSQFNE